MQLHQSLVGSVVIGAELGREDHGSIPRNCDRAGGVNQKKILIKTRVLRKFVFLSKKKAN
jgi:hypothetical protein